MLSHAPLARARVLFAMLLVVCVWCASSCSAQTFSVAVYSDVNCTVPYSVSSLSLSVQSPVANATTFTCLNLDNNSPYSQLRVNCQSSTAGQSMLISYFPASQPDSNCAVRSYNMSTVSASYTNPASPGLPGDAPPTSSTCSSGVYSVYPTGPPGTQPQTTRVYSTFSCPTASSSGAAAAHPALRHTFVSVMPALLGAALMLVVL